MRAAPGSALWLLRHELRLSWMGAALNRAGQRRPGTVTLVIWCAGWIMLHFLAWALLRPLGSAGLHDPRVAAGIGLLLLVCATFMLSTALKASVMALFERGDLDLLLSSPLPSRSIFAVRLLGVAASTATLFLYLATPFANVGLALGQPGWLALYPVVAAIATLAACAAMLLTLALVRLLGARRTRVLAQVLAAIAGAMLFLLSQAHNLMSHGHGRGSGAAALRFLAAHGLLAPGGMLGLLGRAALGAAAPLLATVLLTVGAFGLTVTRTHRFFVHGLQQAAGLGHAPARPNAPLRLRVRRSLFDTIVVKEWRLIARDPHLISQVLLQLVYLLPLFVLILRGDGGPGPAIGAGLTVLCASLASSLAWIVISAEDAPDLLLSSPAHQRAIRLGKLAASAMPPLALVALPLSWLVLRAPLTGLLVCFTLTAAVFGATLIVLWVGRPAPRSDFKARGKENFLCTFLELLNSVAWGGFAWLLVSLAVQPSGPASGVLAVGAALVLALGLGTPLLAWLLRRRPA
jgi:ABC-2 type transport system permease protein